MVTPKHDNCNIEVESDGITELLEKLTRERNDARKELSHLADLLDAHFERGGTVVGIGTTNKARQEPCSPAGHAPNADISNLAAPSRVNLTTRPRNPSEWSSQRMTARPSSWIPTRSRWPALPRVDTITRSSTTCAHSVSRTQNVHLRAGRKPENQEQRCRPLGATACSPSFEIMNRPKAIIEANNELEQYEMYSEEPLCDHDGDGARQHIATVYDHEEAREILRLWNSLENAESIRAGEDSETN